jgi:two-component system, sensor histidine kinase and response regulator
VLLADDNVINQKVAGRLLQQMGYCPEIARNGQEVLRALEQKPFDLILMDVQMPEMDGLEATRRIRQRQAAGAPPIAHPIAIIAMTAGAMQGDREKCLAAGMDDYVSKPVKPEALQAAIERCATRLGQQPGAATAAGPGAGPVDADPAPGDSNPTDQPVDLSRLLDFACDDREQLAEMSRLYLEQTAEQLDGLEAAFAADNLVEAVRLAHSCAGASGTCGVEGLMLLLRRFEALAKEDQRAELPPLLPEIRREYARVQRFLEQHARQDLIA